MSSLESLIGELALDKFSLVVQVYLASNAADFYFSCKHDLTDNLSNLTKNKRFCSLKNFAGLLCSSCCQIC